MLDDAGEWEHKVAPSGRSITDFSFTTSTAHHTIMVSDLVYMYTYFAHKTNALKVETSKPGPERTPDYSATSSIIGEAFFQASSGPVPMCNGGKEKILTVELPFLMSFKTLKAEMALFMCKLCMYLISASSFVSVSRGSILVTLVVVEGSLSSSGCFWFSVGGWLTGKSWSSIASHSFTSLYSKTVLQKGCWRTFWIKGKRIRAPVLLSYFLSIFPSPV